MAGAAQTLSLPPRPAKAPSGSELARQITDLDLAARERRIESEVLSGNVPNYLRRLCPVPIRQEAGGRTNTAVVYVAPEYLAVGNDQDYLIVPLSPSAAQRIADALECVLPTRKIVDAIYAAAEVRLAPVPIAPSAAMTTVPVFAEHNRVVWSQRQAQLDQHPLGALVAGHKKDVVLSPRLRDSPGKVAIYGWHRANGTAIQPLYLGHSATWVDYSQCIRLVSRHIVLNGQPDTAERVLRDPVLCEVLSDEGPFAATRYPTREPDSRKALLPGFEPQPVFPEQVATFALEPDIRVQVNAPADLSTNFTGIVELILYALPNGNTIEQTVGKVPGPGDDWRHDIQHIGAQTRFLRDCWPDRAVVVACLEAAPKSWPAWRKKHGDEFIPKIVDRIRGLFAGCQMDLVLTGHSGGGSFTFGYLNAVQQIPEEVRRIAFLDSNYAYDSAQGHTEKLVRWLSGNAAISPGAAATAGTTARPGARPGGDGGPFLCVLAYNDANALLDGKPFVSASGGTWGRSLAMQQDLAREFAFTTRNDVAFQRFRALNGRIQFILKENPDRKVLHTVQVERNGFIHAMLTGTPLEGRGYEYFGQRAYEAYIAR